VLFSASRLPPVYAHPEIQHPRLASDKSLRKADKSLQLTPWVLPGKAGGLRQKSTRLNPNAAGRLDSMLCPSYDYSQPEWQVDQYG
jgi:hypothetical protein